MSGYSWSCQVPRAPLHVRGVTSHVMVAGTMSVGITPPSSLVWAHASVLNPPAASVVPSNNGSVQVAVSPCWEEDLPDVLSAHPSLRAWTSTPAAPEVHLPVSSLKTSAFPPFGPGRRSTMPIAATSAWRPFRGCRVIPSRSGPQVCSPPRCSYRYGFRRRAAVVSPSEPLVVCSLPTPRIYSPSASGH